MRVVLVLAVVALGVACYHPDAPDNAPCGPNATCPTGQTCFAGFCRAESEVDAASVADASVISDGDSNMTADAPSGLCAGGDGTCLMSCVATDPDCVTTCGDGRCVGNAGELCGNCAADCATLTPVCGNGACELDEAATCYADCGPTPWMWLDVEQTIVEQINARRITGFTCPNGALPAAPALTELPAFVPTVHEWAWEIAHHNVFISGGAACNGRTNADRQLPADFDAYVQSRGYIDGDAAITGWFTTATICASLMSPLRTKIGVGVAFDVEKGYVVVLE